MFFTGLKNCLQVVSDPVLDPSNHEIQCGDAYACADEGWVSYQILNRSCHMNFSLWQGKFPSLSWNLIAIITANTSSNEILLHIFGFC